MIDSNSRALIIGISGQDGAYLAETLLRKKYKVYGTSRDIHITSFDNLERLGVKNNIELLSMAVTDFRSVIHSIMKADPYEIYNLAGQSSVGLSFEQPAESFESIGIGTLNILESIRLLAKPIKLYNASSSECFGNTPEPADESTAFRPRSPYAVAKAAAFWLVDNYREAYEVFACNGILSNHESPIRPKRFVTQKIVYDACHIKLGKLRKLVLGNINIQRDWGWAPEYVEAMWLMLQQEKPDDFIIATGETWSLTDFIDVVFSYLDLDYRNYVESNAILLRPSDIAVSRSNPSKAKTKLGWQAKFKMGDVARMMVDACLDRLSNTR